MKIQDAELILNADGSIYHLHLQPEHIADNIITVGDPDRVERVSKYFDRVEHKVHKREFYTHTGYIGQKRLTVISTGIGTDNIDIVLNELDALANVDLNNRTVKNSLKSLNIFRIGTSGAMRADIPVDSFLVSNFGVGMDGLLNYYVRTLNQREQTLNRLINECLKENIVAIGVQPTVAEASSALISLFEKKEWHQGITLTATGFYAPQNRMIRAKPQLSDLFTKLEDISFEGLKITNLEMETAAIFGLANILGHKAISLNAILANRRTGQFSADPDKVVDKLIQETLEIIVNSPL
jgi:uridine phosphorylase